MEGSFQNPQAAKSPSTVYESEPTLTVSESSQHMQSVITCFGCIHDKGGQAEHEDIGGCLYKSD